MFIIAEEWSWKRVLEFQTQLNWQTINSSTWKNWYDQLLMNCSKEHIIIKQQMTKSFDQSNKTLEDSITKMTNNCLTFFGEGIAKGTRMLATALATNSPTHHAPPQVYQPQYYGGYMHLLRCTSHNIMVAIHLNQHAKQISQVPQENRSDNGQRTLN